MKGTTMRRIILATVGLLLTAGITLGTAELAAADFKFGPHDTQCQAQPDQPNCVGSH